MLDLPACSQHSDLANNAQHPWSFVAVRQKSEAAGVADASRPPDSGFDTEAVR